MRRISGLLLAVCVTAACGSSPSAPTAAAVVSIGPTGLSPSEVRIKAWGHVTFVNNDTRPHVIVSDPVDIHTDCPPINRVGLLNPGESRETGTLNLTVACGFHDHNNKTDATLKGRIIVE